MCWDPGFFSTGDELIHVYVCLCLDSIPYSFSTGDELMGVYNIMSFDVGVILDSFIAGKKRV